MENYGYESKDVASVPAVQIQPGNTYGPQGGGGQAVTQAPTGFGLPNVPPGLEYLTQVDQILVHQMVELMEALTGIETRNRYTIKNSLGQDIYHVEEESECCMRVCCGNARTFIFHIRDNNGREVMNVRREFMCCNCGCPACACSNRCSWELTVEAPPGTVCGYIRQKQQCIRCSYEVLNEHRETQVTIQGPICVCECPCNDVEFRMYSNDGSEIGLLTKQWAGCVKECFTKADNFGITFPMDMDVRTKANCIGAIFLVDMHLFEYEKNNNNNN